MTHDLFSRWNPSALMEWAKYGYTGGKYNLARSGIPAISNLAAIPGGPYCPDIWGHNEGGHEGLKHRIAQFYHTEPEDILLAQGASQSNFLMAGAILAGGGTAVIESPFYEPVMRGIEVWADRIVRLPRRRENRYQPDPDELRRLITPDTRLIVLTNLHNPTQVLLQDDILTAIIEISRDVDATVMVDEVFLPMLTRDFTIHAFFKGAISVNSLGKSWGLDGLRVGWAVGSRDLIHRAYRLNNLMGVNQPYSTEDLACRILNNDDAMAWLISQADCSAQGRRLFDDFIKQTSGISYVLPAAGISALVELPEGQNDIAFSAELLKTYDTVVFPGCFFECPGSIRVSFGGPQEEVREGLLRLSHAIRNHTL